MSHRVARLAELRSPEGWAAVRRELGVSAFGINSWTAAKDGAAIIADPALRRGATGTAGTTILVVGGKPGEEYGVTGWEANADVFPLFKSGEFSQAKELLEAALAQYPGQAGILYNLACAEARLDEPAAALAHLSQAVELSPQFAGYAQGDEDLASIRNDPGFPGAPDEASA